MKRSFLAAIFFAVGICVFASWLRARAARGQDPPTEAVNGARMAWKRGGFTSALASFENALKLADSCYGRRDMRTANVAIDLVWALEATGRISDARPIIA